MEKKVQLFDPFKVNLPGSIIRPVGTIWDLCVLYQKPGNKPLTHPNRHKAATGSGYEKLEYAIQEFHKLDALPHNINISRIDDGSEKI